MAEAQHVPAPPAPLRLSFKGWLGIWVATGFIVLLTLIGFLLGIVGDLESINRSMAEAASSVGGAGGNVKPLPRHIEDVNMTLTQIDEALRPVPISADDIGGSLGAIKGNLEKVDGSLVATGGSFVRKWVVLC
jgi:hypothetical protein